MKSEENSAKRTIFHLVFPRHAHVAQVVRNEKSGSQK